eukprot:CAMPEP_0181169376 /NCGR_PEP_ID=MMETSP1096-20121128/782_1 /TAXON_ID=156174 ORGANISM="Chrysochromulina ericina, Strain CCMP281" /NCGR_SAMPLE_ID=MMETSP1096 /ASSEMBLY_ACC=CAM_ASM_000453 /LENGTH=112 /DNA_ID=CAMNT_0023256831 /DNA_START=394 /DNA_END=733 /DNA_ORIENTATION=+
MPSARQPPPATGLLGDPQQAKGSTALRLLRKYWVSHPVSGPTLHLLDARSPSGPLQIRTALPVMRAPRASIRPTTLAPWANVRGGVPSPTSGCFQLSIAQKDAVLESASLRG